MGVALLIVVVASFLANTFADEEICGTEEINRSRLGDETVSGQFPWLVALEYRMTGTNYSVGIKCGGAIVHTRFVLTAAQCLNIKNMETYIAWLGVSKLSEANNNKVIKMEFEKTIPHPNYNELQSQNDIALIKLKNDITYSEYIRPICLPVETAILPSTGTQMTISGWGQMGHCGPKTDVKLQLHVPFYTHNECTDKWGLKIRFDQICLSGDSYQGFCWRDIGAPIMEYQPVGTNRRWFTMGIVTSNAGCSSDHPVVVHTRVSSYALWIAQTIAKSLS